jgi:hypothetical protein
MGNSMRLRQMMNSSVCALHKPEIFFIYQGDFDPRTDTHTNTGFFHTDTDFLRDCPISSNPYLGPTPPAI